MEEIFDIYTREGSYLGTAPKSICHNGNPGFYHKPVWIWIINSKGEVLLQKRAKAKKLYPNLWDMPSAGHVDTGETPIEGAIRETYEELGIKTIETDYEFIMEYIHDKGWEIAQVYLLKLDLNIEDFILQKEEVEDIKWYSFDEFIDILYSDKFVPADKEYKDMMVNILKERVI